MEENTCALEDLHPAAHGSSSQRPVSILLDDMAYVEATATPTVHAQLQIGIMSKICFYHPLNSTDADLYHMARVIHAEGPLILLRAQLATGNRNQIEYLVFKGNGRSLDRVPHPTDLEQSRKPGIVFPQGPRGNYLLVALDFPYNKFEYPLYIYSSEDKTWSTKRLANPSPVKGKIAPDTVISLGDDGKVGLVDLSRGILVCDPSCDSPTASFIPMPNLLPRNRMEIEESPSWPGRCYVRWLRDVSFSNGVIKLVEVEHCISIAKIFPELPSNEDVLYDSDLMASGSLYYKEYDEVCSVDGWRVVTWTRSATSNCWSNRCILDVNDIMVDESSLLMSGINSPGCLTVRNLYSYFPTLSADGNVVYFQSVKKFGDEDGWVMALDLGSKTLKALGRCSFARHDPCHRAFRSYEAALVPTHHVPSGTEDSEFYHITQLGNTTHDSNNTKKRAGEPNSCYPKHKCPRLEYSSGDKLSLGLCCHQSACCGKKFGVEDPLPSGAKE